MRCSPPMSRLVEASTLPDAGSNPRFVDETPGVAGLIAPPQDLGEQAVIDWLRTLSRSHSLGPVALQARNAAPETFASDSSQLASDAVFHLPEVPVVFEVPVLFEIPVLSETFTVEPNDEPDYLFPEIAGGADDTEPGSFSLPVSLPEEYVPAPPPVAIPNSLFVSLPPLERESTPEVDVISATDPFPHDAGWARAALDSAALDSAAPENAALDNVALATAALTPPVGISVLAAPPGVDVLSGELPAFVTASFRDHLAAAIRAGAETPTAPPVIATIPPAPFPTAPVPTTSEVASAPSVLLPAGLSLAGLAPLALEPLAPSTQPVTEEPTLAADEFAVSPTVTALPGSGAVIVAARKLTKRRVIGTETVDVLADVTLDLRAGEFVVLTGASGSGKTTLLSCLAGIEMFDRGELLFEGYALSDLTESDRARHRAAAMGFVFQGFHLVSILTAVENVELPLLVAGWDAKDAREEAEAALNLVGLSGRMQQLPDQLSGGEQQRVAIARALVGEPRIVFADEPTGNLDDSSAKKIAHLFHELHADGLTLVIATHDQRLISLATTVVDVKDGRALERRGPRTIV